MTDEAPWCYEREALEKPEGCEALQQATAEIERLRAALAEIHDALVGRFDLPTLTAASRGYALTGDVVGIVQRIRELQNRPSPD